MNKKIVFITLVVVALALAAAFWYYTTRNFSKEILKMEILGPDTASMGSEITYAVKYKNSSNFILQNPKLIFELPDNSLTEDGSTRLSQTVKDIYPGVEESVQFKARLLGKENDLKTAHAWLSYVPENLSVRYEADTTFTTKIDTVPITLSFDLPSKGEKGKEINYAINYFSNVDYPLENLSVKVDPVTGFNFESAVPDSLDSAEWKLDTLNKAMGGRISIKGMVTADIGAHLAFSAHLGMWQDGTFIILKDVSQDVEVVDSSVPVSQQVNGPTLAIFQKAYYSSQAGIENSGPIPPQADQATSYVVTWQVKNYFDDLKNVKVRMKLPANVMPVDNISPENQSGNFSFDNASREIVWSVGDLPAGTGVANYPASISFQVSLTPGLSQRGVLAGLVGQATVSGEDQTTGHTVQSTAPAVNTSLPDDQVDSGGGIVQ